MSSWGKTFMAMVSIIEKAAELGYMAALCDMGIISKKSKYWI